MIGRLFIVFGVIIGAIYPLTLDSYMYATLHHWYGEAHTFSAMGWLFVVIGLLLEVLSYALSNKWHSIDPPTFEERIKRVEEDNDEKKQS